VYADVQLVVRDVNGRSAGYRQAVPVLGTTAAAPKTASCGVLSAAETHHVIVNAPHADGSRLPTTGLPFGLPFAGLGVLALVLAVRRRRT
jgi:hypothetical protein